ncbi:MAG: inorganic diphosphatase [Bacteroidota bacterium]
MIIIIESPKGSAQKYTYDADSNSLQLKKILPAGMVFPYDFGLIPGTLGEDGDPLDALLLNEYPTFPGCRVECRLIGALRAFQAEGRNKKIRNDRFLFVNDDSPVFSQLHTITDIPSRLLTEIEWFFIQHHQQERKTFTITGRIGREQADKMIKKSLQKSKT